MNFKKIVLIIACLLFFRLDTFATDACDRLVPQYASFMWKVTMASNLRTYPCTYKSSVLWVSKIWDTYKVISKVDWWYQVQLDDWKIYRLWEKAISKTNDVVVETIVVTETITKENNLEYVLTSRDRVLVNTFVNKMNIIIERKWLSYRDLIALKISDLIDSWKYPVRLIAILEEIIKEINNITIIKQEVNTISNSVVNTYNLKNIDINKVKDTWLSWYNAVRKDLWKNSYSYDLKLESTALDWSKTSKEKWEISHKRNLWDAYYDYNIITSWFKDRGVVCKNINRITHTENIWWWQYSCNDSECTDELIKAIKSTFDFYMAEKGKSYDAHYRSITQTYFSKIWLWIELEEVKDWYFKYYLTVHYCTELM